MTFTKKETEQLKEFAKHKESKNCILSKEDLETLLRNEMTISLEMSGNDIELLISDSAGHSLCQELSESLDSIKISIKNATELLISREKKDKIVKEIQDEFKESNIRYQENLSCLLFEVNMKMGGFDEQKERAVEFMKQIGFKGKVFFSIEDIEENL